MSATCTGPASAAMRTRSAWTSKARSASSPSSAGWATPQACTQPIVFVGPALAVDDLRNATGLHGLPRRGSLGRNDPCQEHRQADHRPGQRARRDRPESEFRPAWHPGIPNLCGDAGLRADERGHHDVRIRRFRQHPGHRAQQRDEDRVRLHGVRARSRGHASASRIARLLVHGAEINSVSSATYRQANNVYDRRTGTAGEGSITAGVTGSRYVTGRCYRSGQHRRGSLRPGCRSNPAQEKVSRFEPAAPSRAIRQGATRVWGAAGSASAPPGRFLGRGTHHRQSAVPQFSPAPKPEVRSRSPRSIVPRDRARRARSGSSRPTCCRSVRGS